MPIFRRRDPPNTEPTPVMEAAERLKLLAEDLLRATAALDATVVEEVIRDDRAKRPPTGIRG